MMEMILFALTFWLICGVLTAGILIGEFGSRARGEAWVFGLLLGPVGHITWFLLSGGCRSGWRL